MSMTRSGYRNTVLMGMIALFGVSAFVFFQGQKESEKIVDAQNELTKLKQELENAARLSAALTELDQLTINENVATQLDILRHLGLEQTDVNFTLGGRQDKTVGETKLYVRSAQVGGKLNYPAALYLADRLHNTKKIILTQVEVTPDSAESDKVNIMISGNIYGLDKKGDTTQGQTEAVQQ